MDIGIEEVKQPRKNYFGFINRYYKLIFISLIILFLVLIIIISLYLGVIYRAELNDLYDRFPQDINDISNLIKGKFSNPKTLIIDIKLEDYIKLKDKRNEALKKGILIKSEDDEVPATITYEDTPIKVDLRLKGDWVRDHLTGEKWSFRINVKGDKTLFGMDEFSIHRPSARNYIHEWIFHKALKSESLIGLRYDFIKVILNGNNLGIYAIEEHFAKELIESNKRREAPILRFDEGLYWQMRDQMPSFVSQNQITFEDELYLSAPISVYESNKINSDPILFNQYTRAKSLLEAFRNEELKTSEVFDVEKYATYLALTDLFGAWHAQAYNNLRFYYNPITSKLEPIGFDASTGQKISDIIYHPSDPLITEKFIHTLFEDDALTEKYIRELERISDPAYLDNFFSQIKNELNQNLNIIYKETPNFDFSKDLYYQNQKVIREILNHPQPLLAYFKEKNQNTLTIEIGNVQYLPIEILSLEYDNKKYNPLSRTIIKGKEDNQLANYEKVQFSFADDLSDDNSSDLTLNFKFLGSSRIKNEKVLPKSPLDIPSAIKDLFRKSSDVGGFNFLEINKDRNIIKIKKGNWIVDKDLIISSNFLVQAEDSTELTLINNASIISYSPLNFKGTKSNPIIIKSEQGRGVLLINTKKESLLENVIFDGLSDPSRESLGITGAITFYESPVYISNTQFLDGTAEDMLNIIHSTFKIEDSLLKETTSDCIDIDFSKGSIINSRFEKCGNDGVDFSGSEIEVNNLEFKNMGDKAISVGEKTKMKIKDVSIATSNIGIAVKDSSSAEIEDINIKNSNYGVTLYRKKPEFGSAQAVVINSDLKDVKIPYFIEEGSTLQIDGKEISEKVKRKELIDKNFDGVKS